MCSVFDSYDYVIVAAVSAGSAIVSALGCVFVICLIFLFKTYYYFIQRIILYHCTATLLRAISTMLRFHRLGYKSESEAIDALCVFSGFTNQLTSWILLMDYSVIVIILLVLTVFGRNGSRLEGLFVVLIFVVPFTFNWIPFINNSYGRSGPWCGIRYLNYNDCTEYEFGRILRIIFETVPQYIFLFMFTSILLLLLAFPVYQNYCKRSGDRNDRQTMMTMKRILSIELLPLLLFCFGVLLLNMISYVNHIYGLVNINNPSYPLWILSAIFAPLQGAYIAVVYTLDRDTLKKLSYKNLVATLCKREEEIQEYPVETSDRSDSMFRSQGTGTHYTRFKDNDNEQLLLD